ncbi:hypothetical protein HJG60_010476 [Phyllostomus discolor]|uniref:Uncharacterized protein n=1 Tax=Phyllostomus discolor TaxID=89673 RepID=A0A834AN75_9CHIR|nr:hypothetical protein HJG60_010476 [Phyllostomus discolor]
MRGEGWTVRAVCTLELGSGPARICLKDKGTIGQEPVCLRDKKRPRDDLNLQKGNKTAWHASRKNVSVRRGDFEHSTVYQLGYYTPQHTHPLWDPLTAHWSAETVAKREKQRKEPFCSGDLTSPSVWDSLNLRAAVLA